MLWTFLSILLCANPQFIPTDTSTLCSQCNWYYERMEMGRCLVQVALQANDVFLTEVSAEEAIVVPCHCLNLLLPWVLRVVSQRDSAVVLSPVKIHRLAKGNLGHAVMVAAEHEVDAGVRLVGGILGPWLIVQFL